MYFICVHNYNKKRRVFGREEKNYRNIRRKKQCQPYALVPKVSESSGHVIRYIMYGRGVSTVCNVNNVGVARYLLLINPTRNKELCPTQLF